MIKPTGYCSAAMFCEDCSCRSCMNTLEHAELVQRHRQAILARSPKAFDAKVRSSFCPVAVYRVYLDTLTPRTGQWSFD